MKNYSKFKLRPAQVLVLSAGCCMASMAMAQVATPTVTSDASNIYYTIPYSGTPSFVRVFVDNDHTASTGYPTGGAGSGFLIENGNLYRYTGSNGSWNWAWVKKVSYAVSDGKATIGLARSDVSPSAIIDSVAQVSSPTYTSAKVTTTLFVASSPTSSTTTTSPTTTTTTSPTTTTTSPTTTTTSSTTTTTSPTSTTVTDTSTATVTSGPTYYISPNGNDSNNGAQATPWRTIQKAANTVNAGDTVVLMDGTYTEGSIGFNRSGTTAKPITFTAQNKWKAVVASTSGCQPGFSINASYITVKDITFSVAGSACTTYTSSNVHIRAWNTVNPTPSNPTSGSAGFHADGLKLTSGLARSEGVKSNQDYTIIENSEADNALEIFNSKNSIIRNNLVYGQDKFGVSIFAKGGVRNAQIYNNVVRNKHADGYGIYLGGYSCDTCFFDPSAKIEAYNSVAYNNVVINDSGNLNALIFAGAKDSAFFNNVVIGGGVVTMEGGYNSGFRAPTTNPTLMNNIIVCNGAQARSGSYSGTLRIESNNFSNCSGTPSQTNAVTGDPMLVNTTSDWNLQGKSPARKRGSRISIVGYDGVAIDVSRDKNGVVRAAPWDLGIYNY